MEYQKQFFLRLNGSDVMINGDVDTEKTNGGKIDIFSDDGGKLLAVIYFEIHPYEKKIVLAPYHFRLLMKKIEGCMVSYKVDGKGVTLCQYGYETNGHYHLAVTIEHEDLHYIKLLNIPRII
jgi:hypothetical protein